MPVQKRGNIWWVRFQHNGQSIAFSAGKGATYEQAKALEAQARQDIVKGRLGQIQYTIEDALARWLENEARGLKDYNKLISNIKAIRPLINNTPIDQAQEVARKIIQQFSHNKPATINRKLAIIRRVCNLAHKWGWIDKQIKIELLPGEQSRHVYLTVPQVIKLAKNSGRAKWHVILAAFTGMRENEILSLKPSDIHDDLILLKNTKNGKPRAIPLNKPAQEALKRLDWDVTYPTLRKSFERARGDADIRFHDLRHTAASFMVRGGASMVAVRDLLGHSSLSVTSRYSHLAVDDLRREVQKMVKKA